jgi:hypothetical protein
MSSAVPISVLRLLVAAICVVGVAGMIVSSIVDNNNGAVVSFGLMTAVAVLVLMAATMAGRGDHDGGAGDSEVLGAEIEARISAMVAAGFDEADVRALVGDAVRLGRSRTDP